MAVSGRTSRCPFSSGYHFVYSNTSGGQCRNPSSYVRHVCISFVSGSRLPVIQISTSEDQYRVWKMWIFALRRPTARVSHYLSICSACCLCSAVDVGGQCRNPTSYVTPCATSTRLRFHFRHCPDASYTRDHGQKITRLHQLSSSPHAGLPILGRDSSPSLTFRP